MGDVSALIVIHWRNSSLVPVTGFAAGLWWVELWMQSPTCCVVSCSVCLFFILLRKFNSVNFVAISCFLFEDCCMFFFVRVYITWWLLHLNLSHQRQRRFAANWKRWLPRLHRSLWIHADFSNIVYENEFSISECRYVYTSSLFKRFVFTKTKLYCCTVLLLLSIKYFFRHKTLSPNFLLFIIWALAEDNSKIWQVDYKRLLNALQHAKEHSHCHVFCLTSCMEDPV